MCRAVQRLPVLLVALHAAGPGGVRLVRDDAADDRCVGNGVDEQQVWVANVVRPLHFPQCRHARNTLRASLSVAICACRRSIPLPAARAAPMPRGRASSTRTPSSMSVRWAGAHQEIGEMGAMGSLSSVRAAAFFVIFPSPGTRWADSRGSHHSRHTVFRVQYARGRCYGQRADRRRRRRRLAVRPEKNHAAVERNGAK